MVSSDRFAELLAPVRPHLVRLARARVGQEAEDVVQDVVCYAWSQCAQWPGDITPELFAGRMARLLKRGILHWRRREGITRRHTAGSLDEECGDILDEAALAIRDRQEADALLTDAELRARVRLALRIAPLTETQRACIAARLARERQAVTARRLGLSSGAVSRSLRAGLRLVRSVGVELVAAPDLDFYAWRVGSPVSTYEKPKYVWAHQARS